jgi:predicted choloylglycine hydrolase
VDWGLFQEGHKSWFSFIDSSAKKYKINLPNFSINEIPKIIADFYKKLVEDQLEIFSNIDIDSKLNTFAKYYKEFNLQKYSDFNLPKSLVKNLTKLEGSVIHRAIGSKQLLR